MLPSEEHLRELRRLSGWNGEFTLGYLLRKLPHGQRVVKVADDYFVANNVHDLTDVNSDGATPEDATARFAIYLLKQGILKKGDK